MPDQTKVSTDVNSNDTNLTVGNLSDADLDAVTGGGTNSGQTAVANSVKDALKKMIDQLSETHHGNI